MTPLDFGEIAAGLGVCGAFMLWIVKRVVSETVTSAVNGFKTDIALLKLSVDRLNRAEDRRVEIALEHGQRR